MKFLRLPSLSLDNVSVNVMIPSSGYAPGQVIPLCIDVNNKSNKHILEFKVELNKVSVCNLHKNLFKSIAAMIEIIYSNCAMFFFTLHLKVLVYNDLIRKQSKKHKSPITSVFIGGCPANTCTVYKNSEIIVPPVPASDIVSSKILHITYELKVNEIRRFVFCIKIKRHHKLKIPFF